jgi:hypothetical protein
VFTTSVAASKAAVVEITKTLRRLDAYPVQFPHEQRLSYGLATASLCCGQACPDRARTCFIEVFWRDSGASSETGGPDIMNRRPEFCAANVNAVLEPGVPDRGN